MNPTMDKGLRAPRKVIRPSDDGGKEHDHKAVMSDDDVETEEVVVFSSRAAYHPLTFLVLAVPLIGLLVRAVMVSIDRSLSRAERVSDYLSLTLYAVVVGVIFGLIIPARYIVYHCQPRETMGTAAAAAAESSVTIGVQTLLCWTWKFSNASSAAVLPSMWTHCIRPCHNFAVLHPPQNIVVISRSEGRWDVLVSPHDKQGFIEAVSQVTQYGRYNAC